MNRGKIDPAERNLQGNIGTGDAIPYQGFGSNPLAAYEATLAVKRPGGVASTSGKKERALEDIKPDWNFMHNAEMQSRFDELNSVGAELFAKGIDPESPSSGQAYVLFQKAKNEFLRDEMISKQLGESYKSIQEKYNANPSKYNPEAIKLVNQWYSRPLSEISKDINNGATPPSLEQYEIFNETDFLENLKKAIEPTQTEEITPKGDKYETTTIKKRSKSAVANLTEGALLQNDKENLSYKYYSDRFEKLPKGAQELILKLAKDEGKDPVIYYASESAYEAVNGRTINKALSDMSDNEYFKTSDGKKKISQRNSMINQILSGSTLSANEEQTTKANRLWNSIYSGKEITVEAGSGFEPSKKITVRSAFVDKNKNSPNYGFVVVRAMDGKEYKMHNMADYNERSAYLINQLLNENTDGVKNKIPNEEFIQYYKPPVEDKYGYRSSEQSTSKSTVEDKYGYRK